MSWRRWSPRPAERSFGSEEATLHRYEVRYVPGQRLYFERDRPMDAADSVIDNEDPDHPSLRSPAVPSDSSRARNSAGA
jgi:hypothetical protein